VSDPLDWPTPECGWGCGEASGAEVSVSSDDGSVTAEPQTPQKRLLSGTSEEHEGHLNTSMFRSVYLLGYDRGRQRVYTLDSPEEKGMKRNLLLSAIIVFLSLPAFAAKLERELKNRWLGAWVVISVESYSDCTGSFTNNRINGNLVKSKGRHAFPAGELAKVQKINAKRSRVDLHMTLAEPLLVPYQEGPFTLYKEARCELEFEVEVPRDAVRGKDVDIVEDLLRMVLERHASEEQAMMSELWNEREIEPYPDDYDRTLAELAIWRAQSANVEVQAQLDRAYEAIDSLTDRLTGDPLYLAGFAEGVEQARSHELSGCPEMLSIDLDNPPYHTPAVAEPPDGEQARSDRGLMDGRLLVYALELLRRLPGCFVPVPDLPPEYAEAGE
jgi:hypothetical protein